MKIWHGYGSEHSANLVLIGTFKDAPSAGQAKDLIDELITQTSSDTDSNQIVIGGASEKFTKGMLDLLMKNHIHDLTPVEIEQFGYDHRVELKDSRVILTTDESDISAFLKVLIDKGARVEVYSAHEYPDTDFGRGKTGN